MTAILEAKNLRFDNTVEWARERDRTDELRSFRDLFVAGDPDTIYMDGNSLGRMPKDSVERICQLSEEWGTSLINGWKNGWFDLSQNVGEKIAELVGAKPNEVIVADSTSINLFKLVLAAIRANSAKRFIVSDELNFPSDLHTLQGAMALSGTAHELRLMKSRDGIGISDKELKKAITPDSALVCLSHTAFKSGFTYDMAEVTQIAHQADALMLWDLSHSVGAMPINLNECSVDLAVGCTYKYLNGGPGSPAFLYVREDLQDRLQNPLPGWFGQKDQFEFQLDHQPAAGIRQFLTGTPSILSLAPVEIGAKISLRAGMNEIRRKSIEQTSYFIQLSKELLSPLGARLNTPEDPRFRGSHVSLGHPKGYAIDQALIKEMKVIPDFRHPDNIRFGLAPLYTSYEEIHHAITRMQTVLTEKLYMKYDETIGGRVT